MGLMGFYTVRPPSRQSPRRILPGQLIHESVFDWMLKFAEYRPTALFWGDNLVWDERNLRDQAIVEDDPYARADRALQALDESNKGKNIMSHELYDALAALSSTC